MTDNQIYSLHCILWNADRLCTDAKILLQNKRFSSVVTLCIYAIEESLKFCACLYEFEHATNSNVVKDHHSEKLRTSDIFQFRETMKVLADASVKSFDLWEQKIASGEWDFSEYEIENAKRGAQAMQNIQNTKDVIWVYFKFFRELQKEVIPVWTKISKERASDLNRIRKESIYVDVDDSGKMLTAPLYFDYELAQKFLGVSESCISFIKSVDLPALPSSMSPQ